MIKARLCSICTVGLAWLLMVLGAGSLSAQSLADLTGTWNLVTFSTPRSFTLLKNGDGHLTSIPEAHNFQMQTGYVSIRVDGTFYGWEGNSMQGALAVSGAGKVSINYGTNTPVEYRINSSNDLMIATSVNSSYQNLHVMLKRPLSPAFIGSLSGAWNVIQFHTPEFLAVTTGVDTNATVNVQAYGDFKLASVPMTVTNNGSLGIQFDEPYTGRITGITRYGTVKATMDTINGEEFYPTLFINASKDVMVAADYFTPESYGQDVVIFLKSPAKTPGNGDLKGNWLVNGFSTPTNVIPDLNNSGYVTNLENNSAFAVADRQCLNVGRDGFFTAALEAPAIGEITAYSSNKALVNVSAKYPDGQSNTVSFTLNSGKNFMVGTQVKGASLRMTLAIKGSQKPNGSADMGLIFFNQQVYWAADTNRTLQRINNLNYKNWTSVPGTTGQHLFVPAITLTNAEYYRVLKGSLTP